MWTLLSSLRFLCSSGGAAHSAPLTHKRVWTNSLKSRRKAGSGSDLVAKSSSSSSLSFVQLSKDCPRARVDTSGSCRLNKAHCRKPWSRLVELISINSDRRCLRDNAIDKCKSTAVLWGSRQDYLSMHRTTDFQYSVRVPLHKTDPAEWSA